MRIVLLVVFVGLVVGMNVLCADALYPDALSASKVADGFWVVVKNGAETSVLYSLPRPNHPNCGQGQQLPPIRQDGKYLLPHRTGQALQHKPPFLLSQDPERLYSLLLRYKACPPSEEGHFIQQHLLQNVSPQVREAALRRLVTIGFFKHSWNDKDSDFFRNLYMQKNLSVPEKRLLLEAFAQGNFYQMKDLYLISLNDSHLARLSGQIFSQMDREAFRAAVLQNAQNSELWQNALLQSELLAHDAEYSQSLLKYYDYQKPENNPNAFIPLLLAPTAPNAKTKNAVKQLLQKSQNTTQYERYHLLARWLYLTNAKPYQHEIVIFLQNNKTNSLITDSIIYPTMLAALDKTHMPGVEKLILDYLKKLKESPNRHLQELVCILFRSPRSPNPSLDELISRYQ